MSKECQCFENLLKILRLLLDICERKYMLESVDRKILGRYIKYCLIEGVGDQRIRRSKKISSDNEVGSGGVMTQEEIEMMLEDMGDSKQYLCLDQMDLREIDFEGINLENINLHEINLKEAKSKFSKSIFKKSRFKKSKFTKNEFSRN